MIKPIGGFAAVAAALCLAACASVPMAPATADQTAKQFAPVADQASVYIYRNENMGAAIKMGIYVDDAPLAQTAANTYVYTLLAPGPHTIRSHAENNSEVQIDAKAGEVYYVWQEVKMGVMSARSKLQIVDPATGQKGVSQTKLVQNQR
ncbi:DUF2846 domain-containing protein [Solimonas variicoloris]|uniref:DUF2846 domain-containing protein n=1 Tax=Solimonas variicoloris TaxID=254408 RepID=UPI000360E4FC|nr:DUF2846 domain-containing protein [Solimonas variicoloris]